MSQRRSITRFAAVLVLLLAVGAAAQDAPALWVQLRDGERPEATDAWHTTGLDWQRPWDVSAPVVDRLRARAERGLGRPLPDPNAAWLVTPSAELGTRAAQELLAADPVVAWVVPVPTRLEVTRRVPPDFSALELHRGAAPGGVASIGAWTVPGARGAGIRVLDVDAGWNLAHLDGPVATLMGAPVPVGAPVYAPDHGTAVLGLLGARDDGVGTTGLAPDATFFVAAVQTASSPFNVPNAIVSALTTLGPGDVILLEISFSPPGATGVAIEFDLPTYNAIQLAVGNGVTVVEAAGNGGSNYDAPFFSTGNGGHHPFLPANDSGAILVGAGGAPGTAADRARLAFSGYGSTIDLQAQGTAVVTTGYGSLYAAGGPDQTYADDFGGTSSAAAIVAGVCAQVQGARLAAGLIPLTPVELALLLQATGSPQLASVAASLEARIGPRPDAQTAAAIALAGPLHLLARIDPPVVSAGLTTPPIVRLRGLGFAASSVVTVDGQPAATTWVDGRTLDVAIAPAQLQVLGPRSITVQTGAAVTGAQLLHVIPPRLGPSGGGYSVLRVDGSPGLPDRRVDVGVGQPWAVQVLQPPSHPGPAAFALFGTLGVPAPTAGWTFAGVFGAAAFPPCPLAPNHPALFTLASTVPLPCGALLPALATPWTAAIPGLPIPVAFTLQGIVEGSPGFLYVTNGVIVDVR